MRSCWLSLQRISRTTPERRQRLITFAPFVDLSAGNQQSYVEDCQVYCRPNILYLRAAILNLGFHDIETLAPKGLHVS